MLDRKEFGDDFKWGVSTAAPQIEGAWNTDGKGPSIWDKFSKEKGKILNNDNGDVACDFYKRYTEDLDLMASMNIPNFRFSLSWPRILPEGTGAVNSNGMDFYDRLIDYTLAIGIEPWITLYHWDLPQKLEDRGGWTNRDIINWFGDYVSLCANKFGDRVKNWMVMNEPMVFTGAGYFLGIHAPGRRGLYNFIPAVHHAAMCQSHGARILKDILPQAHIGTTFSCSHVEPFSDKEQDLEAAKKVDVLLNRLFIEPALGLGYPVKDLSLLERIYKYFKAGDEAMLPFDFDFIGVQNYTREIVRHAPFVPFVQAKLVKAEARKVVTTTMNWEVYPECIYKILKKYAAYPQIKKIIVTENGAAFNDVLLWGKVNDVSRMEYLQSHIKQVLRAKNEGVNVAGYFVWTFTDNFEWAEGYHPRFGLVYIDFRTQKRTVKQSGNWYKKFLKIS